MPPRLYCLLKQVVGFAVPPPRFPRAKGWTWRLVPGRWLDVHGTARDGGGKSNSLRLPGVGREQKESFEELESLLKISRGHVLPGTGAGATRSGPSYSKFAHPSTSRGLFDISHVFAVSSS